MKRTKVLALLMSAAMVTGACPAVALAADEGTGAGTTTEVVTEIEDEMAEETEPTEETEPAEETEGEIKTPVEEKTPDEAGTKAEAGVLAEAKTAVKLLRAGEAREIKNQEELETAIKEGGIVDLEGQTITLDSTLRIANNVTIVNGTLIGPNISGNAVELLNGIDVTLKGVTIQTSAENKNALLAWGTNLTVNGLTIDHTQSVGGAPIIINNGAKATFNGEVSLTLESNSWYGANVDNATADFTGASFSVKTTGTQSVVCSENAGNVKGVTLTKVVTEQHESKAHEQVAYVTDENLPAFVAAKTKAGADVSSIELNKDVTLSEPLFLSEEMTVDGNGYKIIGSAALGKENVVTVTADNVSLDDVTIQSDAANKSCLHVYQSKGVTLTNVTLDNTNTAGGAGMVVNASDVIVKGDLNIKLGENSWGGINVDTTYGKANVAFANDSQVNMTSTKEDVQDAIYIDADNNKDDMTITGAEQAGLAKDKNGNYILASDPGTENPEDPSDKPSDEDKKPADDKKPVVEDKKETEDKKAEESPKTSDNAAPLAALLAMAGSGAVAVGVLKKRKEV